MCRIALVKLKEQLLSMPRISKLVSAGFIVIGFIRVLTDQVLYADGSWNLLQMMTERSFILFRYREFIDLINGFGLVFLLQTNLIQNVAILTKVFGFQNVFVPIVLCFLAMFVSREKKMINLYITFSSVICVYLMGGFPIGEYSLTTSIAILLVSLVLSEKVDQHKYVFIFFSFVLIRSYESTIFFAPTIIYLILRKRKNLNRSNLTYTSALITRSLSVFFLFLAFLNGLVGTVFPRDIANRSNALAIFESLTSGSSIKMLWIILTFAILLGIWIQVREFQLSFVLFLFFLMLPIVVISPKFQYDLRVVTSIVVCFCFIIAYLYSKPQNSKLKLVSKEKSILRFQNLILTLSISLALVAMNTAIGWARYTSSLQQVIYSRSGVIPYSELRGDAEIQQFAWAWTSPTLSVIYRRNDFDGILLNPDANRWQPFAPTVPPRLGTLRWFSE